MTVGPAPLVLPSIFLPLPSPPFTSPRLPSLSLHLQSPMHVKHPLQHDRLQGAVTTLTQAEWSHLGVGTLSVTWGSYTAACFSLLLCVSDKDIIEFYIICIQKYIQGININIVSEKKRVELNAESMSLMSEVTLKVSILLFASTTELVHVSFIRSKCVPLFKIRPNVRKLPKLGI